MRTNPGLPNEPSEIPTDLTSLANRELQTLSARKQHNSRLIILWIGGWRFCAAAWSGSTPREAELRAKFRRTNANQAGGCGVKYSIRKALAQALFLKSRKRFPGTINYVPWCGRAKNSAR